MCYFPLGDLYIVWWLGTFASCIERKCNSLPSVIVIGAGISGISAARILRNASFKVVMLFTLNFFAAHYHFFLSLLMLTPLFLFRYSCWSHGIELVAAFTLTTHLVAQWIWVHHGKYILLCLTFLNELYALYVQCTWHVLFHLLH